VGIGGMKDRNRRTGIAYRRKTIFVSSRCATPRLPSPPWHRLLDACARRKIAIATVKHLLRLAVERRVIRHSFLVSALAKAIWLSLCVRQTGRGLTRRERKRNGGCGVKGGAYLRGMS